MEIISTQHHRQNPSPANSSSTTGSSSSRHTHAGCATQTPPITPRPVSRPESNPNPTTFVQADTTSFKQVVQMLTGSSKPTQQPDPAPSKISIPPIKTSQQKKQGFKLHERRNSFKNGLMINPSVKSGHGHGLSPRVHEMLSPSILDFPALALSPVTPLIKDPFNKSSPSVGNLSQKGFWFHPSPRMASPHGTAEPQLLALFPLNSPGVAKSLV